jgi:hypothetical protein
VQLEPAHDLAVPHQDMIGEHRLDGPAFEPFTLGDPLRVGPAARDLEERDPLLRRQHDALQRDAALPGRARLERLGYEGRTACG